MSPCAIVVTRGDDGAYTSDARDAMMARVVAFESRCRYARLFEETAVFMLRHYTQDVREQRCAGAVLRELKSE